jgi:hypothetical protein
MLYRKGSQTFLGHRLLAPIKSSQVLPALPYEMHSSEERFTQPTKGDNEKIRYYI